MIITVIAAIGVALALPAALIFTLTPPAGQRELADKTERQEESS